VADVPSGLSLTPPQETKTKVGSVLLTVVTMLSCNTVPFGKISTFRRKLVEAGGKLRSLCELHGVTTEKVGRNNLYEDLQTLICASR
jgi:hypothetical protein